MSYQIEPQLDTPAADRLFAAVAALSRPDEIKALLRDLLTIEEIDEATRRFEVARRLAQGESYRSIAEKTGVSTATITRIAYWFHHGTDGYRRALQELSRP